MADRVFTPSEDEQRLLHQVGLSHAVIEAASSRAAEPFWKSEKALGIVGVVLGGALTLLGGWCSQVAASREKEAERAFSLTQEARRERLGVALQVQRNVALALAGSDKLTMVADGRFEDDPQGWRAMTDAANQAAETWRRESEALDLSLRLYGGENAEVKAWKPLRGSVDAYIASTESYYLQQRRTKKPRVPTAAAQTSNVCTAKRQAVIDELDRFGKSVASLALIPGTAR